HALPPLALPRPRQRRPRAREHGGVPGCIADRPQEPVLRRQGDARNAAMAQRRGDAGREDAARSAGGAAHAACAFGNACAAAGEPVVDHAGRSPRMELHHRETVAALEPDWRREANVDWQLIPVFLAIGCIVGFLAGLLGVGGAVTMTPVLMIIFAREGLPSEHIVHIAVATSLATIMFTSISSMRAHARRGAVLWRVAWAPGPGTVPRSP